MCAIVPGDVRFDDFGARRKLQAAGGVGPHSYHIRKVTHAFDDGAHLGERWGHDLDLQNWGLCSRNIVFSILDKTHIRLRTLRFGEQCHVHRLHNLDAHVMSVGKFMVILLLE